MTVIIRLTQSVTIGIEGLTLFIETIYYDISIGSNGFHILRH